MENINYATTVELVVVALKLFRTKVFNVSC